MEYIHPYVPRDLNLPGFIPGFLSQSTILGVFVIASVLVVSFIWILARKEYSKGDSRYAGRDSVVVTIEVITVGLEGPACLLTLYSIAAKKSHSYVLQLAISLGLLYGTALYFITSVLEGDNFAASPFYYYAYYIFANAWWVLIPSLNSDPLLEQYICSS
ncbi:hypothetical protein Ancab_013332 [Ancistrocladus abbreviatus]